VRLDSVAHIACSSDAADIAASIPGLACETIEHDAADEMKDQCEGRGDGKRSDARYFGVSDNLWGCGYYLCRHFDGFLFRFEVRKLLAGRPRKSSSIKWL